MIFRGHPHTRQRQVRGYTSTEIVTSLLVGAILAASVSNRVSDDSAHSTPAATREELRVISSALRQYRADNEVLPSSAQGLEALVLRPGNLPKAPNWRAGGYLERLPLDSWGNPYQYLSPGLHGDFDVWSFGADGRPGGTGDDADIGNWGG